jgi:hypothetical protein
MQARYEPERLSYEVGSRQLRRSLFQLRTFPEIEDEVYDTIPEPSAIIAAG